MIHPRSCNAKPNFYPRSPCGERPNDAIDGCNPDFISIHALLAESDFRQNYECFKWIKFLSTLSLRRATISFSAGRESDTISIHALLAESDLRVLDGSKSSIEISIHALLAESDTASGFRIGSRSQFLSTLSLRRATDTPIKAYNVIKISIHALLAESDFGRFGRFAVDSSHFYPRSPCGERRPVILFRVKRTSISIHALLAESDKPAEIGPNLVNNFYPRSPCGERLSHLRGVRKLFKFLSTLSLRRATEIPSKWRSGTSNFYPRSPCGERRDYVRYCIHARAISIHALLAESDIHREQRTVFCGHFYPRSPCGERPPLTSRITRRQYFYPRSPCGERRINKISAINITNFYPRSPCGERQEIDEHWYKNL